MAEIVVSAAVTVLIEKLLSGDLMKLAKSEGIESKLKKLKTNLNLIKAVLADAGQKHMTETAVQLWLQQLQDLAYDIDDVLDDMETEIMGRNLSDEPHGSTSKFKSKVLTKIMPTCCTNFTPHKMMYGRKMSSKLDEISVRLNDLVEQRDNLGLNINVKVETSLNRNNKRPEETSLVDVSTVLGRDVDQEVLLSKLLGDEPCNQNVSVMSIVGLGGIGKTTLAQLLYNNQIVKDHFQLRAWVCVSDELDVFTVSKAIYQAVAGENKEFANLDLLHVALKEELLSKKFLIVLDDVWSEDPEKWKVLEKPLKGAVGSKIIVTTRKTVVASLMNCAELYNLGVLSEEHSLSLLAKSALGEHNFDKHPSLISVARSIIKKCDGLPLALIAIGRVLKGKGNDDDEWEKLYLSEIWSSPDESGILPALKLSYYDLPLHLKQLFAYCCLFPKDYEFKRDELVLLWMAEGYLLPQSRDKNVMESLGRRYFEELRSRSFFQPSTNSETLYIMHDLMNDLAISVAGEFFFMLDDNMDTNGRKEVFEKFRHFSFTGRQGAQYIKLKELRRSSHLRTFLMVSVGWKNFIALEPLLVELLPQLQFLRVLTLTWYSIIEVPQSVGGLKHLRYLNFSNTSITEVPEEVSELYNLQILLVCDCKVLSRLPVSFAKLINLRHFDNRMTPLLKTSPLGIGRLTSLQTLSKVTIEDASGFKITELKDLVDLQGELSVKGLEKVTDPQEATYANLEGKKGLISLDMEWSDVFDDSRNSLTEYEVFERLKPPPKLKTLNIMYYGGMEFPSWLGDPSFDRLTQLRIEGCRNCTHFNDTTKGSFSYLCELHIRKCPDLVEVSIGSRESVVAIYECNSMTSLTLSTTLQKLYVSECEKLVSISMGEKEDINVGNRSSNMGTGSVLREVNLCDCESLECYRCPNSVEKLDIIKCNSMTSLTLSTTLQELYVRDCDKLVSISMGEKEEVNVSDNVGSRSNSNMGTRSVLREVTLWRCDSLESYNFPNSIEKLVIYKCNSMTSLHELSSSIKSLEISFCRNLKSFPHGRLQSFTSLEELEIIYCESMDDSFPCRSWPPNLRELTIGELKKPMSEWGLQNYPTSLVKLYLIGGNNSGVTSFAMEGDASNTSSTSTSFLLPPSLTTLSISCFEEVESISEVLQHLTHLKELDIYHCPNIKDVPKSTSYLEVYVY